MTQDDTTLISIIADIRDKSGVGAKPMLDELADAIALVIDKAHKRGQESMRERAAAAADDKLAANGYISFVQREGWIGLRAAVGVAICSLPIEQS